MDQRELLDRYEARGDEGDFVEAKRLYEAALLDHPDDPALLNDYGYLLECHGRYAIRSAADAYRRAIELDPDWAKPRFQLISAAAAIGQPDDAIREYLGRVHDLPDDPVSYRYLARAYLQAHRFADAERAARDGLGLAPQDAKLTNLLGEAFAGEGRTDAALERWRDGYVLDPEALDGRYSSAFLLEKAGRLDEAIAEWRFIIDWSHARGNDLDAEWPIREVARLEATRADHAG